MAFQLLFVIWWSEVTHPSYRRLEKSGKNQQNQEAEINRENNQLREVSREKAADGNQQTESNREKATDNNQLQKANREKAAEKKQQTKISVEGSIRKSPIHPAPGPVCDSLRERRFCL